MKFLSLRLILIACPWHMRLSQAAITQKLRNSMNYRLINRQPMFLRCGILGDLLDFGFFWVMLREAEQPMRSRFNWTYPIPIVCDRPLPTHIYYGLGLRTSTDM